MKWHLTGSSSRHPLLVVLLLAASLFTGAAAWAEGRVALVIGNAAYPGGAAATAVNDAGLVAEMLRNAQFTVIEGKDSANAATLALAQQFIEKLGEAGSGSVAYIYLAGRGAQYAGENYFLGVDAAPASEADLPSHGLRIAELTGILDQMQLGAKIVVLDMARDPALPALAGRLVPGLAAMEPGPETLIAAPATPGTLAPEEAGPYGSYATALLEMSVEPGVAMDPLFAKVRLRVHEKSGGATTPWHVTNLSMLVTLFEPAQAQPGDGTDPEAAAAGLVDRDSAAMALRGRSMCQMTVEQAYAVAVERNALDGYEEFVRCHPSAAVAPRVRRLMAQLREADTWRATRAAGSREAYWSYLRRYPRGPHAQEARAFLGTFGAPPEPPPAFVPVEFDVPPPPPEEVAIFEVPGMALAPLPPPPPIIDVFLPPPPPAFLDLAPPVIVAGAFLPVPFAIRMPVPVVPAVRVVNIVRVTNITRVDRRTLLGGGRVPGVVRLPPRPVGIGRVDPAGPGRLPVGRVTAIGRPVGAGVIRPPATPGAIGGLRPPGMLTGPGPRPPVAGVVPPVAGTGPRVFPPSGGLRPPTAPTSGLVPPGGAGIRPPVTPAVGGLRPPTAPAGLVSPGGGPGLKPLPPVSSMPPLPPGGRVGPVSPGGAFVPGGRPPGVIGGPGAIGRPPVATLPAGPGHGIMHPPGHVGPAIRQPGFRQPGFRQPPIRQPGFHQPGFRQPGFRPPVASQPGFRQPGFRQPGFRQPGFRQPAFRQPTFRPPVVRQPAFRQPGFRAPAFRQPAFRQPAFRAPAFRQPTFRAPSFRAPSARAPAFRAPRATGGGNRRFRF